MDSDDEVATPRYQYLDFDPVEDSEITEVQVPAGPDPSPSDFVSGYSSFIDDPSLVAKYRPSAFAPTQVRPDRLVRHRTTRPMGRAPRRACNLHARGSARSRSGITITTLRRR
jgi:hypothetical protein